MELINFRNLINSDRFKSDRIIVVETSITDDEIENFLMGSSILHYHRHIHNQYDGDTLVDSLMSALCKWLPPKVHETLDLQIISSNKGLDTRVYTFYVHEFLAMALIGK